jgi:hypothetical protein
MTVLQRAVHNTADVTAVLHADLHYVAVWRSADTQNRTATSDYLRHCPSVLTEQLGYRRAYFDKI